MSRNPLNDAMPPRALAARWVIHGTLTLETALHLGGDGTERVDMAVLRNPRDGMPLLPGTTFAGALRSALADRLAGYAEAEPPAVTTLFGGARGDDDGSQSPLIVFDAVGEIPTGQGVEIRDGVAISPATGIAEDHKKYNYEVLPAGTTFPVRVDLLLPPPAIRGNASPSDEKSLLGRLAAALDAFAHGQNAFGAKRSRGLGRVNAVWAATRFELGSPEGWLEWILSDHKKPFAAIPYQTCIRDALETAAPEALRPLSFPGDARKRVVIDLDLQVAHDVLVRSPGTDPGAPDVSHLHSSGAAILPGTSLAGVMRAHALRIAKLIRDGQNDAPAWVDRLFGRRFEGLRPSGKRKPLASRLRIGEAPLAGSTPQRQTRVAIDRFTQGTVDTALFDEQTEVGGRATVRLARVYRPES
jgi:CRISPR/Cas system CSM-associated protein Csm3 (group 7 of RAMP superfamily)